MRRKEERQKPAETYEETVEVRCDLCGSVAPNPGDVGEFGNGAWSTRGGYDFDEIRVSRKKGTHYPDDERHEDLREVYDVCPDCWTGKVIPWLESQRAAPRQGADE